MTLVLGACSSLESGKVDYRSASAAKPPSLDVPPDLTQLSKDTRYVVIDGAISASGLQKAASPTASSPIAALSVGDVRIERAGNQRWLVVGRSAEVLWEPIKRFWQDNGFVLTKEQSDLGIMETDWAENRAKIPMDVIRRTIGRLIDGLYSTSERDKFRTRLERNAQGETEIFISHRGLIENFTSSEKNQTAWQPRASDPELEAEFLRRLMVVLGVAKEAAAAAQVETRTLKAIARVATEDGQPVVRIEEGFDRAWRRVGLALDRTGFTVEDRDRKQGLYFVRYVAPPTESKNEGFFGKIFGSSEKISTTLKYRILVRTQAESSTVSVQSEKGEPDSSTTAERIVKMLADDIK
ncbi:MAG: outer membrane protein assembly factor BamC [Rhodoferax sp.]|nr:outer membrane protein assembly factor BamC [Rhodoferax sp.]